MSNTYIFLWVRTAPDFSRSEGSGGTCELPEIKNRSKPDCEVGRMAGLELVFL
jgi:hypothetical protein